VIQVSALYTDEQTKYNYGRPIKVRQLPTHPLMDVCMLYAGHFEFIWWSLEIVPCFHLYWCPIIRTTENKNKGWCASSRKRQD
jgi:hypothetical protein